MLKSCGRISDGGVPPVTVTSNDSVVRLKLWSSALQTTVVVPNANVEPEAGEQCTSICPSTLSTALALYSTTRASVTIARGTVTTGGVVSEMTTRKLPVVVPNWSVALQVTTVEPIGK
jgi:hypothetical protein